MGIDWKRADTEGWDIEDVDKPRSVADTCPRCGQASRLLERERVKNLTVFGVSLVATERGGRVFECALCRARFEAPEGGVASDEDLDAAVIDQLTGLHDQLDKVEDDIALWSGRVTIAARSRDAALAREAQDMVERRSRAAASLRAEVDRLGRQLRRGSAADETAQAPVRRGLLLTAASAPTAAEGDEQAPAPAAPEAAGPRVDDELAALRQKVAAKVAAVGAPGAAPSKEDELTALKRRLGMIPKEGAGDAPAEPAESAPPGDAAPIDDEVAALKRRLRGDAAPVASPVEAPAPSDDDELSDLKSRLRPKR
ncbi:MAG: hypothetical protein Q7V43_37350 [Myxococcales bacterium]|nr:hypothetical protein [Myxococcales bacterium]